MSYLSQSAVEFDALPKKTQLAINLRLYATQRKYDGVSGIVHTTARTCLSRTGGEFTSCQHIVNDTVARFGPGWVVFGEIWHPTDAQSKISGDARRNKPAPHLVFVVFDAVPVDAYNEGFYEADYNERYLYCYAHVVPGKEDSLLLAAHYNPGTIDPAQLKAQLGSGKGYDGIVRRDMLAPWRPGKCKYGAVIKDKPSMTFDLEVVGIEEGLGRNAGRVGALLLRFRDGVILKSSGMSDEERDLWWKDPTLIVGKIVEIEAMGESSKGSLREPRFKGVRYDKDKADF